MAEYLILKHYSNDSRQGTIVAVCVMNALHLF